jgi:hypothetical protein
VPYDPVSSASLQRLTVQVQGAGDDPERVYELARPRDGVVDVRETVLGNPPREYAERADALCERFERLQRERRRLSAELYQIRTWLDGRA